MKNVILSLETAQNLMNYLASKPYSEVYQGIPELNAAIQAALKPEPEVIVEG